MIFYLLFFWLLVEKSQLNRWLDGVWLNIASASASASATIAHIDDSNDKSEQVSSGIAQ